MGTNCMGEYPDRDKVEQFSKFLCQWNQICQTTWQITNSAVVEHFID